MEGERGKLPSQPKPWSQPSQPGKKKSVEKLEKEMDVNQDFQNIEEVLIRRSLAEALKQVPHELLFFHFLFGQRRRHGTR